jgi:tryptophanyl-tRNA synthetase
LRLTLDRAHQSKLQVADPDASLDDANVRQRLKHGLFSYPILQAADILIHRATHVPVGEDQRQHLEFARECVTNFNHTYSTDVLVPPQTLIARSSRRVMSLRDPTKKMSKSDPSPNSCIFLTDPPDTIKKKIMGAVTDSDPFVTYDWENRPGVANLIDISSALDRQCRSSADLAENFRGRTIQKLKERLVRLVCDELGSFQARYYRFLEKPSFLRHYDLQGAKRANDSAAETLALVKEAVGLHDLDPPEALTKKTVDPMYEIREG